MTRKLLQSKKLEFATTPGIFFFAVVLSSRFFDSKSSYFFIGTIGALSFTVLTLGLRISAREKLATP